MSHYAKYKDLAPPQPKPTDTTTPNYIVDIKDNNHKQTLIDAYNILVVDIWADWCGPCKQIMPAYKKLAADFYRKGVCGFCKEDFNLHLTSDIGGVPTFHIYFNRQLVHQVLGANLKEVAAKVQELLAQVPPSQPPNPHHHHKQQYPSAILNNSVRYQN